MCCLMVVCNEMKKAKPFVKWAGGKSNLLSQLDVLLPVDFCNMPEVTYIEPFVGGGAMLLHMLKNYRNIKRAVINDINEDLIRCYLLIKDNPDILIDRLKLLEDTFYQCDAIDRKELFYAYREQYNSATLGPNERAAMFVFLNHTCFNGLYRVNSKGEFNVPFGRYKRPIICNEKVILDDHRLLNSVDLIVRAPGDYRLVKRNISLKGYNFVYLDPPYRPLSITSYFKEYSKYPFGDKQQEELKLFCDVLTKRDCQIMLSNSDSKNEDGTSYFEELYKEYKIHKVYAHRAINAFAEKRTRLSEVLITNY